MRNRGAIDPFKINDYIARDGYEAAYKALKEMDSKKIIQTILDSGLRGRGGAGFPTGLKWKFASQPQSEEKYIICNADEGDPGAFVCGEETALIHSIQGQRGNPRLKIPYPAEKGLFNKPTVIDNVETLANIAPIILKGSDWFTKIGTDKSKGTKVFSITGDIVNVGCIEVPIGTSIQTVIEDIASPMEGAKIKAVQLGGPSGGCLPVQYFDTPLDYEPLKDLGTIMGSGGMIAINEKKSAVDIARFFVRFCASESCGKCLPCREGTSQMVNILNKICSGNGTTEDINKLEDLALVVKKTSLCGLGKTASNPVLSTLQYFRNEYEAIVQ